jgi:hypothetical protein
MSLRREELKYIDYRVPPELAHLILQFDGSILVDRTRGEVAARIERLAASRPLSMWCYGIGAVEGLEFETSEHDGVQRADFIEAKHILYKLIFERESRRVRGIHVVARNAGDIVQGFSLAMKLGATVDDIAWMHHVYPTFGEGLKAAAEKARPVPVRA